MNVDQRKTMENNVQKIHKKISPHNGLASLKKKQETK